MKPQQLAKVFLIFIGFVIATVGLVWLAGFFFFLFSKTNPIGKTDLMTWFTYWQHYSGNEVIAKRLNVSAITAAAVAYGIPLLAIFSAMRDDKLLHGAARFANYGEVEKAGLFSDSGIIIGKFKNKYLMFSGMQFVLLAAPTRSGKGVGVVIPNLLNYQDSLVVLDVKLENFLITSGFRKKHGQEVYLFNPFSKTGNSHRYNPLGYISDDPRQRPAEILAIGYALYPSSGGGNSFFDDAARNLFLGLCLYLCETPTLPRTIGELLRQSSGKGKPTKTHLQDIIKARNFREVVEINDDGEEEKTFIPIVEWDGEGLPPLSSDCVDALNRFINTSDNTLSSILASFNVPLTIWTSPLFDAATSANDFDLRDIRKKRMTIYVGIPANKLAEAELLINVFFSQLINLNTDELLHAKPELKYPCLLLMDEFTSAGRIAIIDKANSFMAGYGLRLLTIIQSPSQLEAEPRKGYGKAGARTLITNHACQILYTPREQKDANEYSEMLGTFTFKAKGKSRQLGGKSGGGRSESETDQKRALMLPQELKELSQKQQIINLENTKPILCEKITYFNDPVFVDRLKSVSPSLAALGRRLPTKDELERAWGAGECAITVPFIDLDEHEREVKRADLEANKSISSAPSTGKKSVTTAETEIEASNPEPPPLDLTALLLGTPKAVAATAFDSEDLGANSEEANAIANSILGMFETASDDDTDSIEHEYQDTDETASDDDTDSIEHEYQDTDETASDDDTDGIEAISPALQSVETDDFDSLIADAHGFSDVQLDDDDLLDGIDQFCDTNETASDDDTDGIEHEYQDTNETAFDDDTDGIEHEYQDTNETTIEDANNKRTLIDLSLLEKPLPSKCE